MAAVSDALPSPGAPVTEGTSAIMPPPRAEMLPVVGTAAGVDLATATGVGFAGSGDGAAAIGWAPTPTGCPATLDAMGVWLIWLGSQAKNDPAALLAMFCATVGVNAAHGSLEPLPETTSS